MPYQQIQGNHLLFENSVQDTPLIMIEIMKAAHHYNFTRT